jgi:hypothetical protein
MIFARTRSMSVMWVERTLDECGATSQFDPTDIRTLIDCRATQSCTGETCALLQQPPSIRQCRRAAGHQVREVACTGIVVPTPGLFRPATYAGLSRTFAGAETRVNLLRDYWLNWKPCCRKTCSTSVMERNNAWLRELIGRLSGARVLSVTRPPLALQR